MEDSKALLEALCEASLEGDQEAAAFLTMFAPWIASQEARRKLSLQAGTDSVH
jgi:hypothetical protein